MSSTDGLGLGARRRATTAARRTTTLDGLHENVKKGVATYDQEQRQQSRRATLGLAPDPRTLQAKLDALSKQAVSNRAKVGEINDRVGRILEDFDDATTDAMLQYDLAGARLPIDEIPSSQASHILESMRASLHHAVMAQAETLEDIPTEDTTLIPSTTDFIDDVLDSSRLQQRRLTSTALQLSKLTGLQRAELEEKIALLEGALSDAEHQYATLQFKHAALGKDVTRLSAELQSLKQTQTKLLSNLSDAKKEREAAEVALHLEAQAREAALDATIRGLKRKELQMTRALREAEDRIKQLLEAPSPAAPSSSPGVSLPPFATSPPPFEANSPVLPTTPKPESPPKPTLSRKTTSRAESIKASRIYAGAPVVYTHMDTTVDVDGAAAKDTSPTKTQAAPSSSKRMASSTKLALSTALPPLSSPRAALTSPRTGPSTSGTNALGVSTLIQPSSPFAAVAMSDSSATVPSTSSKVDSVVVFPCQAPETVLGQRIVEATPSPPVSATEVTEACVTSTPRYAFLSRGPTHQASSGDLHNDTIPEEALPNTLAMPVAMQSPTSARDVPSWRLVAHEVLSAMSDSLVLRLRFAGPTRPSESVSVQHWTLCHLATHAGVVFRISETTVQADASDGIFVIVKMQLGSSPAIALDVAGKHTANHAPAPMLKHLHSITALSTATPTADMASSSESSDKMFSAAVPAHRTELVLCDAVAWGTTQTLHPDCEPPRVADESVNMAERPRTSSGPLTPWKTGMPNRGLSIGDGRPQTRPKSCACFKNADFFKNSARLSSHHEHCPLVDEPRRRRHSLAATMVLDKTVDSCLRSPASVNVVQIRFPTNSASNR
ncbi:hypothetical protein SDRG_09396 [Saprolegnia diclina VS20]|uniref:Uncharacterized protein n=1 Tax=Saprolegnia diclina (strain VS20) TaxID=1156394 RepID=T0Q4V8_SAPDV|nr:hypothetical protein SDRG_09396 [Saprolegnia diclina VS20]EQC32864.1 hypothetical protein SDRG_09396 [Saprolegnia diclina VS20]|eukprot:XP_008613550.1 hypothetical protein SDRG_09396 [Saprolegnia diclina VS20]